MTYKFCFVLPILLSACFPSTVEPKDLFFKNVMQLCGQSFNGSIVSRDPVDSDIASESLLVHFESCQNGTIRAPFHVGDNKSRTWVLKNTSDGLILKHEHRHEDGSEDAVSQYGGTSTLGTKRRQEFPVDDYSVDLFNAEGLAPSTANIWALEIKPNDIFAYELSRDGRFFRAEFDISQTTRQGKK